MAVLYIEACPFSTRCEPLVKNTKESSMDSFFLLRLSAWNFESVATVKPKYIFCLWPSVNRYTDCFIHYYDSYFVS